MQVIQYDAPEQGAILRPAEIALAGAVALVIDCPEMMDLAAAETKAVKQRLADMETMRKAITRPIDEAKAKIMDLFRPATETLQKTETVLKDKMVGYQLAERRKAEEAQRLAEEEARKLRDLAARESAAREAGAREEAARLVAEAQAAAAQGDQARAADLAVAATQTIEAAHEECAHIEMAAAVVPSAVVSAPAAPKGTSLRGKWKARVIDKQRVVAFVAANPHFLEILDVNESALNKLAGALQKKLPIDGVEPYEDFTVAVSKRG